MNVIISVVRKGGGKKRKQVPRVWTVGEKPKKGRSKARRGARNRQKEETGIIDSKEERSWTHLREKTRASADGAVSFFLKRRRLDLCVLLVREDWLMIR
jgi:hypothetical protein